MSVLMFLAWMSITPLPASIVTPEWLAGNLQDPNVVVLDVASSTDFARGHIPGARLIRSDRLVVQRAGIPDELPTTAELEQLFSQAGVGNDARIVLYSREPLLATRAWFTLDYLGHGERAAILDGGFAEWRNAGRPVTRASSQVPAATFNARPDSTKLVTRDELYDATTTGRVGGAPVVLFDGRPVYQYTGKVRGEAVDSPGHVPGAQCAPWMAAYKSTPVRDAIGPDQRVVTIVERTTFKSDEQLREFYNLRGVTDESRIILYCRTGMEATAHYFALRHLGYRNVALYDGSYVEWNRVERVERTASR